MMERNNMIAISKRDGVEVKTYTLNIDELYKLIDRKACEFYGRYGGRPKYIKIPEWVYNALRGHSEFGLAFRPVGNGFRNEPETLFGYIVCETVSIEQIEDIEVF